MTPQLPLSMLPSFEQLELSINDLKVISETINFLSKRVEKCIDRINVRLANIKGKAEIGKHTNKQLYQD
ncbi:hypothetical protein QTN47_12600 [Danxiaibacter flavus]|uniref:Uncharacterized protein n=1 Tax=Danxiaibacter flavus TaxID=3049108 RepID=A0ABV3ZFN6_9BACT|nr:hypothetical protein QNM32_12605 [Chitinophagaceae bacterium DXS]